MLEFKILGPLRVLVDGEEVPIDDPLDRAFLAALLNQPNREVGAEGLQILLNVTTTQAHQGAEGVRQFIEALPGDTRLVINPAGWYLLDVDEALIDATKARSLLYEARHQPLQRRVALLREAQALWPQPSSLDSRSSLTFWLEVSKELTIAEEAVRQYARSAGSHAILSIDAAEPLDEVNQFPPFDGTLLTATDTLSVSMYLSDEGSHTAVEAAVEEVLARTGLSVVERDPPVLGSWFRKLRASEVGTMAAHVADSRLVLAHDAQVTSTMLEHLGPVLTALQSTKDAVVRIGAVLIVKLDDQLVVHQLTAAQQLQLDHQPQLAMAPREILTALELEPGPVPETGT